MRKSTFITRRVWENEFPADLRRKILRYLYRGWVIDKMFVAELIDYLHFNVFEEDSEQVVLDIYAALDTDGDGTEC